AFGMPVISEIPPLPSRFRHRNEIVTVEHPADPFVEAYRALRTVVLFAASAGVLAERPSNGSNGSSGTNGNGERGTRGDDHHIVVVTSPAAGEGKTTTVAHLASVLAEIGKSVLVVSADLRRPHLHDLFGVPREPGLTEVLSGDPDAPRLSELNLRTN